MHIDHCMAFRVEKISLMRDVPAPLGDQRVHLLEEVARALSHAQDFETVVRAGTRAAVPALADVAIMMVQREGGEDWVEVANRDSAMAAKVADSLRPLLPAVRRAARADAGQGRQFRWITKLNPGMIRFLNREPALLEFLLKLRVHSLLAVPLRSGGAIFGGMAFLRTGEGLPFHAADLSVAQVLARRVAVAIETAELHTRSQDEQRQRSRLEDALQKWIQVFDHAGWGAAIVDGQDQRIEAVNPAFARLHGFPDPETLGGRLYTEILAPENRNEPAHWPAPDQSSPYESCHLRKNGAPFPVLTTVTPLVTDAGTTSYVVTIQDLTELKRAEERLRRAQRLEAVGRLAGGVAHEVNNMMTIILGFSDLLVRSGGISVERGRDIEEIRKAATRAGRITQQLLAFSRQQILQPTDLEINEVITELVPVLRLLLPANIELETSLAPIGPAVHADRAQLDQVIINLAFNARDAMAGGGALRLSTESRWLAAEDGRRLIGIPIPPAQYALISVVDTGHGMDAVTLQQVFEPFFTTKPIGSGTGLGLATVYGIVKQSGGYVWVESARGQGTTVTVCLPQVEQRVTVAPPVSAAPSAECRIGTVLVVEDEEGVRELAHRVLEEQGHRIIDARDGLEALAKLEEFGSDLDLVLSDVVVPGIGTSELDRTVREVRPDLPILYMSGYSRDEMIERGMIDPDRPFLQKPFTADELTELVCRELGTEIEARGGQVTT
jgi:two-component system cell cycle sensor histidine kinase/response regulator CckA